MAKETFKKHMSPPKENIRFSRDVFKLVSGTAIAQLLSVIASPVLTRLYGPEAFGLAALFISITSVLSVVACFRYELSIMLPKNDEEAANQLGISMSSAFLVGILIVPICWYCGPYMLKRLNAQGMEPYLWLIAPMVLMSGITMALNYWNSRMKRFGQLSLSNIGNSVSAILAKLASGFIGYTTAGGLIFGGFVGAMAASLMLGLHAWHHDKNTLRKSLSWRKMMLGLRRYRRFPIFDTWSALLGTLSWQLPTFLLSSFFSSAVVGYYALGMMALQLPMSLIGSSISQVFFQRAAEAKFNGRLAQIVEDTVSQLGIISLFPLLLLALIGKELFTLVFGSNWAEAGIYAQVLAIWIFFVLLGSPISTLFSILEQQKIALIINILTITTRAGALIIGGLRGDPRLALILFSAVGVITYAGSTFWLLRQVGASPMRISAILAQYLSYSLLIIFIIAIAKEILLLNPATIVVIGVLSSIPYYTIVIKRDEALRELIASIMRSS